MCSFIGAADPDVRARVADYKTRLKDKVQQGIDALEQKGWSAFMQD